MKESRRR